VISDIVDAAQANEHWCFLYASIRCDRTSSTHYYF
jgi:hypothetical protein